VKQKLMDKYPNVWQQKYKEFSKSYNDAVNGKIATLKTDFLVFKNNLSITLDDNKKQVFDFFNSYACYPQLHTAQVYMAAVDNIVHKEIPLKIKFARDYIVNQIDNTELEVKNNASRVFAEVHSEAKEWLKGAMKEAGKELGGIMSPQLAPDLLTFLKDKSAKAKNTLTDFQNNNEEAINRLLGEGRNMLITANDEFNDFIKKEKLELENARNYLLTVTHDAKDQLKAEGNNLKVQAEAFFKGLEAKILGSIRIKDLLGINFNLPKLEMKKDKAVYQFITKDFKSFDVKVFRFVPNLKGKPCSLLVYMEKPFRNPNDYYSKTKLENFTVSIFNECLLVEFISLEMISSRDEKNKVSVKLGDITFGNELAFLSALSQGFMLPGTGLSIKMSLENINITYALPIPGISGGAFTFDNLRFVVGADIPLPIGSGKNKPMGVILGINSAIDPFVIGVAIFGGMGFFTIETTPKYIQRIDTGMSFGGLFRINLVIAAGQAYLQAGIRYIYIRDQLGSSTMELYAIITCGANVTVFGFIQVSVVFTMYLKYTSADSSLYGVASVSYSIRIGFFSKSFTLTFSHKISGTGNKKADSDTSKIFRPHQQQKSLAGQHNYSEDMYLTDDGTWQSLNQIATPRYANYEEPVSEADQELEGTKAILRKMFKAYNFKKSL
jgi:hypothetical protein